MTYATNKRTPADVDVRRGLQVYQYAWSNFISCRRSGCLARPWWNIRFTRPLRGVSSVQRHYWCDEHVPPKHRARWSALNPESS